MRLLLDTHTLIWFLQDSPALSERVRELIEDERNICLISIATGWEMAIKVGLGKLNPPIPLPDLFPAGLERLNFEILPIKSEHVHRLLELPLHHRDPFDRMLIAQALSENLTMVGCDVAFNAYGAASIW